MIPEFKIPKEYLVAIHCSFEYPSGTGSLYGTVWSEDHPAFKALRDHLAAGFYVKCDHMARNGDVVLSPFSLNGRKYERGDRFTGASNQGVIEGLK